MSNQEWWVAVRKAAAFWRNVKQNQNAEANSALFPAQDSAVRKLRDPGARLTRVGSPSRSGRSKQ